LIFQTGYYYSNSINDWVPFNFSGTLIGNSQWISDSASSNISILTDALRADKKSVIASYTCIRDESGNWKCGCDSNGLCGNWKLQVFNTSSCVPSCACSSSTLNGQACSSSNNCGVCPGTQLAGNGTEDSPFIIADCYGLQQMEISLSCLIILLL